MDDRVSMVLLPHEQRARIKRTMLHAEAREEKYFELSCCCATAGIAHCKYSTARVFFDFLVFRGAQKSGCCAVVEVEWANC